MTKDLTVILPCAGKAARLDLPYPKEMMKIDNRHALIDYSFDFFRHSEMNVRFVIVVRPEKANLVQYLARYADTFDLVFAYQKKAYPEVIGAIRSVKGLFGEQNLVLLPDTIMELRAGSPRLEELIGKALEVSDWAFLYKTETDEARLRQMGCLAVKDSRIVDYKDKPLTEVSRFNAYWTGFAFRRSAFEPSIDVMDKSTRKLEVTADEFRQSRLYGAAGVEVASFVDLGTWDSVHARIRDSYNPSKEPV